MSSMAALISVADGAILYNATYDGNNTTIRNFVNATAMKNDASQTITSTAVNQLTLAYDGTHSGTFTVDVNGKLTLNATTTITVTPALTVTGALTCSAAATVGTTLAVTGAATLSSTLAVTGATTLSSTLAITKTDAASAFTVTAGTGTNAATHQFANTGGTCYVGMDSSTAASFNNGNYAFNIYAPVAIVFSTANATGTPTLTLATNKSATFAGALAITGALTGATTGAFSGLLAAAAAVTVGTTLGVTGASTLAAVTCTTLAPSGNITVGASTFTVTAATGAVTCGPLTSAGGGTIVTTGFYDVGPTPATTIGAGGGIRLSTGSVIATRNAANNANIVVASWVADVLSLAPVMDLTLGASGNKIGFYGAAGAARSASWVNQTAVASKADLGAAPTVGALAAWASAIDVMLKANGFYST